MIAITSLNVCTALGSHVPTLARRISRGDTAMAHRAELLGLPSDLAAVIDGPDLRPWPVRRKDRKLFSRAAALAIPSAGETLSVFQGNPELLGLFVGVGREPPDDGESEAALAASARNGQLDVSLLAGQGLALYPPLLSLKTLPNLVLAHLAITFGIRGPNSALAGESAAGLAALAEAFWCVVEGRAPAALAGASDSRVSLGAARDLYRLGWADAHRLPGEGSVFALLELESTAIRRGAPVLARITSVERGPARPPPTRPHWPALGDLGAPDGLLHMALAIHRGRETCIEGSDDEGGMVRIHIDFP